jgi:hypothetical protein
MTQPIHRGELDDASYQARELLAQYGIAMHVASILEISLINVLAFAQSAAPGVAFDQADYMANSRKHTRSSMGVLVNALSPHITEEPELTAALRESVTTRNQLAHHYFRDHDLDFLTSAGRELMHAEATAAEDLFASTGALLEPVTYRQFASVGIDADTVRSRLAKIAADRANIAARG